MAQTERCVKQGLRVQARIADKVADMGLKYFENN